MTEPLTEEQYTIFVDSRTSGPGKDTEELIGRLHELDVPLHGEASRLLMAAVGLASEAGELLDLVKKIFFHNKAWSKENYINLLKEVGDAEWYMANVRIALGCSRDEILQLNKVKLEKRYPETFLPDGHDIVTVSRQRIATQGGPSEED